MDEAQSLELVLAKKICKILKVLYEQSERSGEGCTMILCGGQASQARVGLTAL